MKGCATILAARLWLLAIREGVIACLISLCVVRMEALLQHGVGGHLPPRALHDGRKSFRKVFLVRERWLVLVAFVLVQSVAVPREIGLTLVVPATHVILGAPYPPLHLLEIVPVPLLERVTQCLLRVCDSLSVCARRVQKLGEDLEPMTWVTQVFNPANPHWPFCAGVFAGWVGWTKLEQVVTKRSFS